ncbi:MAG: ATP-dependent sacrificial sulfur transferase LarE [Planctomycetaceae bacterium]|nr:ATP-dependent sacrificial sulfur transferase LarE [Planctomycetaceae bacterium]
MGELRSKSEKLEEYIRGLGRVVVAFSGGVDSTFLLRFSYDVLGSGVLAVTARSCSFPQRELDAAQEFTRKNGIEHVVVDSEELEIEGFSSNPLNRCYLCKTGLFTKIRQVAAARGIEHIAEGSNADDEGDYRPGMQAVAEFGILSPLRHAKLTKNEIRQLSEKLGLPTWNKQSFACLSSRFPYGENISRERLAMIDNAEQFLLDAGFVQVRVRFHGNLARIETDENGFKLLLSEKKLRENIYKKFKEIGFTYVSIDLLGYRTGSMNETLPIVNRS